MRKRAEYQHEIGINIFEDKFLEKTVDCFDAVEAVLKAIMDAAGIQNNALSKKGKDALDEIKAFTDKAKELKQKRNQLEADLAAIDLEE